MRGDCFGRGLLGKRRSWHFLSSGAVCPPTAWRRHEAGLFFLDFFREDGFRWTTVELDEGEPIPELDPFDLMVVMGGPQDVWQEDQYPWFLEEKAAIRKFVLDMERPYLGICLGHQLLADATGERVGLAKSPEVGVLTVSRTEAGRHDRVLSALPDPMTVLQWHGAEVTAIPVCVPKTSSTFDWLKESPNVSA